VEEVYLIKMVNFIEITSDIIDLVRGTQDDIMNQLGKTCTIFYTPKLIPCANCVNGVWITGGPMPFTFGVCPLCNSKGVIAQEVTENIIMLLNWTPRNWNYPIKSIEVREPNGLLQTKGYLTDAIKLRNCQYMQITGVDGYSHYTFKLLGEPIDPGTIVQSRYFIAEWQRI